MRVRAIMLRTFRTFALAAAALLVLAEDGFAQPQGKGAPQPGAVPQQQFPISPEIQNDLGRIARALESVNSDTERRRVQDDLRAQQDMAWWAQVLALVAGLEALLTFFGVLIMAFMLPAMTSASRQARRMANTAHDALAQSKRHARQELRAYLVAVGGKAGVTRLGLRADIVIRNCGKTPAYDLIAKGAMRFVKPPVSVEYSESEHFKEQSVLGPGCDQEFKIYFPGSFGQSEQREVSDREGRNIIVYGEVEYRDVFNEAQTTQFQFIASGNLLVGEVLSPAPEGNAAT